MNTKLLIVDDEPDILATLKNALVMRNYQVECAQSGEEAISLYEADPFDLVITDVRMPGIDGVKVLKRLKQIDEHAAVIILTGYASIEDAIATLKNNGALDYLTKPLSNIDTLYLSIERALGKRKLQLENASLISNLRNKQIELEKQNEKISRTKAALIESENKYRKLIETSPDGILYNSLDTTVIMANQQATKILGFTNGKDLVGHNLCDFVEEVDREAAQEGLQTLLKEGQLHDLVINLLRKDGSIFPGELSVSLITDRSGQPSHFMVVARDITKRKEFEQMLLEKDRRYALSTQAAKVGVWEWNMQTGEFYLDPNIKDILGYSDKEIPNDIEIWSSYIHTEDKEPVMSAFQSHIEGKTKEYVVEHRMQHKDGSIRWILARGIAIRDAKGIVHKVVGTDMDITALKESELALSKAHDELEERVTQRTAELARINQQLSEEIEIHKQMEIELKNQEVELKLKSQNLIEVNTALTVLLEKREADKSMLEETVLINTKRLIIPYLDKIKRSNLSPIQTKYIDVIESHLNEIVSPFYRTLSAKYLDLTPKEIQVADLICQGKTSKEMAEIFNVSARSVEFHRNSLRKKFGLTKKKVNLRTYLLSFK